MVTRGVDAGGEAGSLAQLIAANRGRSGAMARFRTRLRHKSEVSAGYLGLGFAVLGGLLMVRGLASLAWSWSAGPSRWLSLLAWAVLTVTFVVGVVIARRHGEIIPLWFSRTLTAVGVLAVGSDFAAFALDGLATPFYPTAVIGCSACLLACLPLQPLRRSVEATVVLAVAGGGTVVIGYLHEPSSLGAGVTGMLLGLTPVAAGISMISVTDKYFGRKIDQAVTESLVTVSAWGHGVAAASKLRRLDSDAERLLASVSRLPLTDPIDQAIAARAEVLGNELRLALVSDHEQTWLQIAVSESDHLSRTVQLVDPAAVAAGLDPAQRRDLLALVWLAVASAAAPALAITFAPAQHDHGTAGPSTVEFSLTGTRRRGIDPAVWPLFSRLGRHIIELGADRALITVDLDWATGHLGGSPVQATPANHRQPDPDHK